MANGVSYLMDEYQTLYDNYVKERTNQQNKIKEQQEQLAQKDTRLNAVISSAVSALVASGKSSEEIAMLLGIPVEDVRKVAEK